MSEVVLISDEKGRKYIARLDDGMMSIVGLGTVDSEIIRKGLVSGSVMIGSRNLLVRRASIDDIISVIERKAQTLTSKDIALIIHHCDIRSGSRVVEGGAGSGALTIALLSKTAPAGKVTTYELREDFADVTRRNVELASLSEHWDLKLANICKELDEKDVDAVILDIPNPWECVGIAENALRMGGHFCAFVPNMNQLEKTVKEIKGHAFTDVKSLETLQREMVIHEGGVRPSFDMLGHTGYLAFARKSKRR